MFTFNIGGTPALSMLALSDIDVDTLYLSSDQKAVIMQDSREGGHIVFDLVSNDIQIYDCNEQSEIIENHPALAVLFPSETVKVAMRLEIMGGGVE